jgi:hypothetical protein
MAEKCSVTSAAVAIAIVAVAMAMASTDAAITKTLLTSYSGPGGCFGQTATVGSCGCSDLEFYAGQDFKGDTATFYTETGCAGTPYQVNAGFRGIQFCGKSFAV